MGLVARGLPLLGRPPAARNAGAGELGMRGVGEATGVFGCDQRIVACGEDEGRRRRTRPLVSDPGGEVRDQRAWLGADARRQWNGYL